jgi:FkbM family methyltransferase
MCRQEFMGCSRWIKVKAPPQTLDYFCEQYNIIHVDLLEIDVEGFESNVLRE